MEARRLKRAEEMVPWREFSLSLTVASMLASSASFSCGDAVVAAVAVVAGDGIFIARLISNI